MSITPAASPRNPKSLRPRFRFRLKWRKDHWSLESNDHYQNFETLQAALDYVRWLQRNGARLHARLEERVGRDWREIPLDGGAGS